jgi:hypothetical protein
MLDALDDAGESVAAVAGVDLPMDHALYDIDHFGADAQRAAGIDDIADVGELQALLAR